VQAGSFEDRDNAVSLAAQLRARGYAVAISDGPLYRVWVGAYLDRGTAEQLASNLRSNGFDATLASR
jgi:cell division protein FtsN